MKMHQLAETNLNNVAFDPQVIRVFEIEFAVNSKAAGSPASHPIRLKPRSVAA